MCDLPDRRVDDIEYDYALRLRSEAVAVDDLHLHPMEPRRVRVSPGYRF